MNRKIPPFVVGALLSLAGVAMADDAPSAQPVKTSKQKMHECMTQERANNSGMTKEDMKKTCAAKLQSEQNHPSRPQPSPDQTHI
jgi:hypothetical protein